jgi:uncharacterized protein YdbL (DUF1318 family)
MAIRINIGTAFDNKGLVVARKEMATLKSSVGSLKTNFLLLGAALTGAGTLIAKNAQSLARIETINTQTATTIQSMGNAANISAGEVEKLAGSLEALTATEAEQIQEGANLLLTFGNISNQFGKGNDIFTRTTEIMVDMARVLKTGPATEAIRLGKALNDPTRGMTALTKAGVSFTEQQKEQVRSLQSSGDMLGAQKLILDELQKQFGGSGAAYANTFTGQLELMGHELGTIGEEATMAVMPALQDMVGQLRELIPIIGPQLKAAIESVDWKALVQSVVDFTKFLVENATAIANAAIALFALNTAVKLINIAFALGKVAIVVYTGLQAAFATTTATATVAATLFNIALRALPFVAIISALGLVVTGIMNVGNESSRNKPYVDAYGGAIRKSGEDAQWAAGRYGIATDAVNQFNGAVVGSISTSAAYDRAEANRFKNMAAASKASAAKFKTGIPNLSSLLAGVTGGGGSAGNTDSGLAQAAAEAERVAREASAEAERVARETADALAEIERQAQAERDRAAAIEQERLDTRLRGYQSFADSVKNLFGQIKDSILSSFDLPKLGNSVNSITRNIAKLLDRTKNFAKNISQLSGLGLNSALLQQVIQAGPMAGSQLAQAIVGGGSAFVGQLNQAYGEFGNLASGIAGVGTQAAFANQEVVNNYYQIEVSGGVGSGPTIGKAIVDAIKSYERSSGAVWQGA